MAARRARRLARPPSGGGGRRAPVCEPGALPPGAETGIVVTVALAAMLAPLNSTMIAVALPRLVAGFHSTVASTEWLVTSYLIAMASLQPAAGKVGDRLGRRRSILGGLGVFALASAGAALAPDLPLLFVFRCLQAAAGALAFPNGTALLREVVPPPRRGARFGAVGSATSVAAALGPPLGGVVVGLFGWRAMFAFNVVLVVPALLLGWRVRPRPAAVGTPARFDLLGAVQLSAVLAGTAALLNRLHGGATWWLLAPALAVVAQPRFFALRSFTAATAAVALSNLAFYTTLLALPLLLGRAGWSAEAVGALLASLSGASALGAPVGGRLADRLGRRRPAVGGLLLFTAGLLPLAFGATAASLGAGRWLLAGCLLVAGVGQGLYGPGGQAAAVEVVAPREAGAAAGAYSTSRYLGSIVGSSVLAALIALQPRGWGPSPLFTLVAASGAAAALAATGLHDRPPAAA